MEIRTILKKARQRCILLGIVEGFLLSLSLLFILFALYPFVDGVEKFAPLALLGFAVAIYHRLKFSSDELKLARQIETRFPHLNEELISYLELERNREAVESYSPFLLKMLSDELKEKLGSVNPAKAFGVNRDYLRTFALCLFIFWLSSVAFTERFVEKLYGITPRGFIVVHPGDAKVFEDSTLTIKAELLGVLDSPVLEVEGVGEIKGERIAPSIFSFRLRLKAGRYRYLVRAEDIATSPYNLTVLERPYVDELVAYLHYPAYTHMGSDTIAEPQYLMAVEGTRIKLVGKAFYSDSLFVISPEGRKFIRRGGGKFSYSFVMRESGKLAFAATREGLATDCPGDIYLDVVKDEPPSVAILEPVGEFNLPEDMRVTILGYLEDDFGLSAVRGLRVFQGDTSEFEIKTYSGNALVDTVLFGLDLSNLFLLPGDEVEFYLVGIDTKGQKGISQPLVLRVPTLEEIYAEAEAASTKGEQAASELREKAVELKRKMEEMEQLLKEERSIDWSKKEEVRELVEKQKAALEQMEKMIEELDRMMERIEASPSISPELLEKIQEVRELFEEVMTEEMKESLRKLEEALNRLNPEAIRKALSELKLNQERMMENLERMANLLKRFKEESELMRLSEMAERLAEEQKEIKEQCESREGEELRNAAEREEALKEELEQMRKSLEELKQSLSETADSAFADSLSALESELQELKNMASEAAQAMRMGQKQSGMKRMSEVENRLRKMSQSFLSMHMNLMAQRRARLIEMLRNVREASLFVSERQEEVLKEWEKLEPRDIAVREDALRRAVDRAIKQYMDIMKESLLANPRIAAYLGSAKRELEKARSLCENNRVLEAQGSAHRALQSLNKAMLEMFNCQSCMSSCCSPTGLQEALQTLAQMAQQQASINQRMQSLMPIPTPMPQEVEQKLAQLAARQQAISEALQDLTSKLTEEGLLRALEEAARQAAEIAKKMKEKQVDERLLREQEKLLTRLLEAQRSIRKREFTRKRESKPGKEYAAQSPGPLKELKERERLRRALLEARKERLPLRMRRLIEAYFKTLLQSP